jgi:hypothetical protein
MKKSDLRKLDKLLYHLHTAYGEDDMDAHFHLIRDVMAEVYNREQTS